VVRQLTRFRTVNRGHQPSVLTDIGARLHRSGTLEQ